MPAVERKRTPKINRRDSPATVISYTESVEIASGDIARLAYSLWESGGCQDGSALEDWLRAEQQLQSRR
jgi:Protein of unknown function (DUF2934)